MRFKTRETHQEALSTKLAMGLNETRAAQRAEVTDGHVGAELLVEALPAGRQHVAGDVACIGQRARGNLEPRLQNTVAGHQEVVMMAAGSSGVAAQSKQSAPQQLEARELYFRPFAYIVNDARVRQGADGVSGHHGPAGRAGHDGPAGQRGRDGGTFFGNHRHSHRRENNTPWDRRRPQEHGSDGGS
eukprot:g5826.t1